MRIAPTLNAERFASQFGTQTARGHMLMGLKRPDFNEIAASNPDFLLGAARPLSPSVGIGPGGAVRWSSRAILL